MGSDELLLIIGAATLAVGAVFLYVILGTAIGAFTGWVLGLTLFGWWVRLGFEQLGIMVTDLTTLGATLGFIAGFFVSHYRSKGDKD
jgi:hypothetical protein